MAYIPNYQFPIPAPVGGKPGMPPVNPAALTPTPVDNGLIDQISPDALRALYESARVDLGEIGGGTGPGTGEGGGGRTDPAGRTTDAFGIGGGARTSDPGVGTSGIMLPGISGIAPDSDLNRLINAYTGQRGPATGLEEDYLNNQKLINWGLGLIGPTGAGTLAKLAGKLYAKRFYGQGGTLQNPADPEAMAPYQEDDPLEAFNKSVDDRDPNTWGAQQTPIQSYVGKNGVLGYGMDPRGGFTPTQGGVRGSGGWSRQSDGSYRLHRSGYAPPRSDSSSGGQQLGKMGDPPSTK